MMTTNALFSEIHCGAWVDAPDAAELARAADCVIENHLDTICVKPSAVGTLWPWIEGRGITIMARIDGATGLTRQITDVLRQGADGAIVSLTPATLRSWANDIAVVRDDLFFNKKLTVCLDIDGVDENSWPEISTLLARIRADAVMFDMNRDAGDASDFVGRVYGILNVWDWDMFDGKLQWANLSELRMVQAWRLIQKMRPDIAAQTQFFVAI